MKKLKTTVLLVLIANVSLFAFSKPHDNKRPADGSNYDMMNAPKVKTAPFSRGIAFDNSLELFVEGKHKMLIDTETDNILFDHLQEGKDYIRVYTDNADHNKAIIIWQIKKKNPKTGKIKWKIYTFKKFPSLGWRPVNNRTTTVKKFR